MAGYALARFPLSWKVALPHLVLDPVDAHDAADRHHHPALPVLQLLQHAEHQDCLVIAYTAFNLPFATWMMKSYFQDLPWSWRRLPWSTAIPVGGVPPCRPAAGAPGPRCHFHLLLDHLVERIFARAYRHADRAIANPADWHCGPRHPIQYLLGEISASGFMACVPIVIFAFIVQKHLVRGLSFGAVKGEKWPQSASRMSSRNLVTS